MGIQCKLGISFFLSCRFWKWNLGCQLGHNCLYIISHLISLTFWIPQQSTYKFPIKYMLEEYPSKKKTNMIKHFFSKLWWEVSYTCSFILYKFGIAILVLSSRDKNNMNQQKLKLLETCILIKNVCELSFKS